MTFKLVLIILGMFMTVYFIANGVNIWLCAFNAFFDGVLLTGYMRDLKDGKQ